MKKTNKIGKKTLICFLATWIAIGGGVGYGITKHQQNKINKNVESTIIFNFNNQKIDATNRLLEINNFILSHLAQQENVNSKEVSAGTKEMQAQWAEVAFMTAALTGSYQFDNMDLSVPKEGYILNPVVGTDDWLAPDLVNFQQIYNYMVIIKLFTETSGNTTQFTPLWLYVTNLAVTDIEAAQAGQFIVMNHINTIFELYDYRSNGPTEQQQVDDFLTILSNSLTYRLDITTFIYIYSYLWQSSNQKHFDYIITQVLYNQLPTLVFKQNIKYTIHPGLNLDNFGDKSTDDPAVLWNELEANPAISTNDIAKLWNDSASPVGYTGLWTRNNSSQLAFGNEFWNANNSFDYRPLTVDETPISEPINSFANAHTNPKQAFVYADSDGKVLQTESTSTTNPDGTTSSTSTSVIYAYTTIAPFVFASDYNSNGIVINYEASMYAIDNGDETVSPANKSDTGAINIFEYLTGATEGDREYKISQLYVFYTLYKNDSNITNNAFRYWNDQGFYITLTGSYESDYSALIPILLQG